MDKLNNLGNQPDLVLRNLLDQLYMTSTLVRAKTEGNEFDETTIRILALSSEPQGIRPGSIMEQVSIGGPALTKRLQTLERVKLIETHKIKSDGRGYIVTCTKLGSRYLHDFQSQLISSFSHATTNWSQAELVLITDLLQRLNHDMEHQG